jgi:DNA-binding transcriptional LysR family regulator
MNLAQAEAFLAVAEELHFRRSAERLGLSEARVSRLVASFEREIGGALFERTSRKVTLTALGASLRDQLAPAHAQLLEAVDHARAAATSTRETLRVGLFATVDGPSITQLVDTFHARQPGISVALREVDPTLEPYTSLRRGEIDVLISWLNVDDPDLTIGPPIEERSRVLAVARGHRLAARPSVSVEDLADEKVALMPPSFPTALYDAIVPPCTPSGRHIPRTGPSGTFHEVIAQIASGLIVHPTVTSMPILARDDIVLVPFSDLPPLTLGLLWCTARESRKVRALADVARSAPARTPRGRPPLSGSSAAPVS